MKIQAVTKMQISMKRFIRGGWGEYMRQRDDEDVIVIFFIIVFIMRAVTHYGVYVYNIPSFDIW